MANPPMADAMASATSTQAPTSHPPVSSEAPTDEADDAGSRCPAAGLSTRTVGSTSHQRLWGSHTALFGVAETRRRSPRWSRRGARSTSSAPRRAARLRPGPTTLASE